MTFSTLQQFLVANPITDGYDKNDGDGAHLQTTQRWLSWRDYPSLRSMYVAKDTQIMMKIIIIFMAILSPVVCDIDFTFISIPGDTGKWVAHLLYFARDP